jgi:hypothetical protein
LTARTALWRAAATLVLSAAAAGGAGFAAAADEPSLVGIWYSAFQPDEPDVMSLIEFRADGTFREEFRKCRSGDVVGKQFESGTWSVADGTEHTVTDTINGDAAQVEDSYRIESLTPTERRIRMESKDQDYEFVGHRVETFEFPDCFTGT